MTSEEVFRLLLSAADDVGRVFDHRDLVEWPPGIFDSVLSLGIIRCSTGVLTAACPSCADGHVEVVSKRPGPGGDARLFMYCPEQLRLEVTAEMCRGWEIDPDGLAARVAAALELKSRPKPVIPNRLWRLGRIPWKGKTRAILLATRLADADGTSVAAHVGVGGQAIVIIPSQVPDDRVWPGRVPAVVALDQIAAIDSDRFVIDGVALMDTVAEADSIAESASLLPIDPEIKKQIVRRQVRAEIKGHLTDDVLIAARLTHGSTRRAATALTVQLGRPVSKDQVQRAIQRFGGVNALAETADSPSVARTVASQSRDRGIKNATYR